MHGRWPGIPTVQVTGSRRVRMGDQQKYIYRNPCQLKLEMTITRLVGLEIGTDYMVLLLIRGVARCGKIWSFMTFKNNDSFLRSKREKGLNTV
jgi:hypothetical protein